MRLKLQFLTLSCLPLPHYLTLRELSEAYDWLEKYKASLKEAELHQVCTEAGCSEWTIHPFHPEVRTIGRTTPPHPSGSENPSSNAL